MLSQTTETRHARRQSNTILLESFGYLDVHVFLMYPPLSKHSHGKSKWPSKSWIFHGYVSLPECRWTMRKPQKRHEFCAVPCKVFDLEIASLCDVIPSRYACTTTLHPLQPGRHDLTGARLDMEGEFPSFWGEDKFMMEMEVMQKEKSCKVEIISLWL